MNKSASSTTSYIDIMEKNHMEIPWHDYASDDSNVLIAQAGLIEKASVIGRVGLIMLSCGTGAWRVRTSMNKLSKELGVTCTVDVGLMSIEFNCFDGNDCISQSLSIANTGVNTSKLYRMEQFVESFPKEEAHLTGEEIHKRLDEIEKIHALYSPAKLGLAAALACCAFTFLLGGGPVEMILAFIAAGIGNVIRTKLIKHHFTLFLNIAVSISAACLMYAICLKAAEIFFHVPARPAGRTKSIFPSVSLPICSRRARLVAVSLFRSIGASLFLRRDSFRHRRSPAPWSLLKRTTCRALQVARFSTSRQCTPHFVRESGIFSRGTTVLWFRTPAEFKISAT